MADREQLRRLQEDWELLARQDPMWSILSDPATRGGGWDQEAFFATGREFVDQLMARVTQLAPDLHRDVAIDFGCGLGRLTQALCNHFERAVGIDIAPSMITGAEAYNQHGDRCEYRVNDRSDLAMLPDQSVDFVNSYIVLQHIPPKATASYLAEFARVLRPEGMAAFTLPARPALTPRGMLLRMPKVVIHAYSRRRFGFVMQMNAIRRDKVLAIAARGHLIPVAIEPSDSAGRHWMTYTYFLRRSASEPTAAGIRT